MAGVAAIMLMAQERDSYSVAGLATAAYLVMGALIGPQIFRLIDTFGQRRVVPAQLAVHVPAFAGMIVSTLTAEATWPIYLLAAVAGASQPDAGTLVRTRWAALLRGDPLLRTAFAWESLLDDAVSVLGPLIGAFVAVRFSPTAALLLSTALLIVGIVVLITQRSTEPVPAGRQVISRARPAILLPGVGILGGIFVFLGGAIGTLDVVTVAFTDAAGVPDATGALVAIPAAGSLLVGAAFGAARLRSTPLTQSLVAGSVLALMMMLLPQLGQVALLALGLFVAGAARAPTLISATMVIEGIVPPTRLSEALAWSQSGLSVGIAVATPVTGLVIDEVGAGPAYWVPATCALAAVLLTAIGCGSLRRLIAVAGPGRPPAIGRE